MSKRKKNKGAKKREKRQQARREKTKQRKKAIASGEVKRESESLDGMKRAPAPELLPAAVLVAGAMLPIIAVRWAPAWPAWTFGLVWLASLFVSTLVARGIAHRRPPSWDPILFFGVGGLLAMLLWSHDSGAVWITNHGSEAVSWSVDGGIETRLVPKQRARLDLRAGKHTALVGGEPFDFEIAARQRALLAHGPSPCVLIGAQRFEGRQTLIAEGAPEPVICPASIREAADGAAGTP
jgi:hypothetical protein